MFFVRDAPKTQGRGKFECKNVGKIYKANMKQKKSSIIKIKKKNFKTTELG